MMQKLSVEELCIKLKPIFGKKIDEIYFRYAMAESKEEKEEITQILNILYQKNLNKLLDKKVLLEPPTKEVMIGEYPLATISYANKKLFPFSLREKDWIRHVCISGMSGSGKTTLGFHIIDNFIKKDKPFLIFDWKKSFRPLTLIDSEIMCFTIGNNSVANLFKININQPPKGIEPKEWINILCDLIIESFFVSYGVHKVLLETLDESFREWGIYQGSQNYPTWNHIKWCLEEKLSKTRGREASWLESALRVATILTFGNFGKVCNYKEKDSLSVEDILNKKVIFELNSLGNIEKKFFCEFVLMYIYKLEKARQTNQPDEFKQIILVDEAHNIFLKEKTNFVGESVTDIIYREIREYGIGLICLDQHISKLSDTVKGNSACHIAFQQQLPQDIWEISKLTQLKESEQFFSMLPVGSAIVKLSERYTSPFLIEVSPVDLRKKIVTDKDIENRMKCFSMQREVETGVDKEFNRALIRELRLEERQEEKIEEIPSEKAEQEKVEKVKKPIRKIKKFEKKIEKKPQEQETVPNNPLTPVQQVLYEFVQKKLTEGRDLKELENLIEGGKEEGNYTSADVGKVVNYAMENQFKALTNSPQNVTTNPLKNVTPLKKRKVYKKDNLLLKYNLTNEQKKFLVFLQDNLDSDDSTVNTYKKLKLSTRKGNKIKNELLNKNLIKIEEQKNNKGWKKIIRLNNHIH